jgi:GTP-binding protein HflX
MEAVHSVIRELSADGKPTVTAFNKLDRVENPEALAARLKQCPDSAALSAITGEGIGDLLAILERSLAAWRHEATYRIPPAQSDLLAEIHRVGHVTDLRYDGDVAVVAAHVPPELAGKLTRFL